MTIELFIGPLIGGIIGLITNGIAIRMLFRPLKAIKLLGFTLPFTPGLIPKEKNRIAKSLGNVVAGTLVNEAVVKKGLLSQEMDEKITRALNTWIEKNHDSEQTLREILFSFTGEEQGLDLLDKTTTKITSLSYERMNNLQLGNVLSEVAVVEIVSNLQGSMFAMLINDSLIHSAKVKIAEIIDHLIESRGEEILENIVNTETESLLDSKLCDLYNRYEAKLPEATQWVLSTYHQVVEKNIGTMLHALDLSQLVEDQINGFDVLEFEKNHS
ncbi:DUF445 domain-containing protein [Acetobacterium bakii]|uniref:DUF445 domain-containing protein n=1 Tax=Acetobacterium bakii TaxID=52689 RepID=UPI000E0F5104|nr:DUF445 family protein [Acetobacterium bakii]